MTHLIDEFLPRADFAEAHQRWIDAGPDHVWQALTALSLQDLTITRPLMWLRRPGATGGRAGQPLMTGGPVEMLKMEEDSYAIGGSIARPWQRDGENQEVHSLEDFRAFTTPGWVKYLTDFRLEAKKGGTTLSTSTRVVATSPSARRRFRAYWFVIRGFSGVIRRDMLRSVDRLATSSAARPAE